MIKSGLTPIQPDHRDFSLLHTFKNHPVFGGVIADPSTLPDTFSIYSGQAIPNQNENDTRFPFLIPPLPDGCTGEAGAFESGLQDGAPYNPQDLYLNTPPGGPGGRDIRDMLSTLINRGPRAADGSFGPKRVAYFNAYGAGKIDDFDAARIALWINQSERRGVYLGTFWYTEFEAPNLDGSLPTPASFATSDFTTRHCHLATGWRPDGHGDYEIQDISWQGMDYANAGIDYIPRTLYNKLMAQPSSGAFTITKILGAQPIPIGMQAYYDHVIYSLTQFIRNIFGV